MNWIKRQLKKLSTWLFVVFVGATAYASVGLPAKMPAQMTQDKYIAQDLPTLEQLIETDRQPNGKYKFRPKTMINGVSYTVHEYEDPKGNIGYTIFVDKEVDGVKYTMATGTGVQKQYRTHGWKALLLLSEIATTTATTTKLK